MSDWTHSMCADCWIETHPAAAGYVVAEPVRLIDPPKTTCCFCGEATDIGIYVRADPKELEHCNHEATS